MRHMQALIALDDLRSMSRAAQRLTISQPAMTQLVAELEQMLETTLFLRHSRGVTPTAVALDLLPVARRIITATEDGAELIASHNRRDGGLVRLAATGGAQTGILPRSLPDFGASHPDIQVQIATIDGQGIDAAFAGDAFDLVLCRWREVVPEGWEFVACCDDALMVICGAGHPMAATGPVDAAALAGATWLANHVTTIARHHFDAFARAAGWPELREVQIVTRSPLVLWPMLRRGDLLSLLPVSIVQSWIEAGEMVALDTPLTRPLDPMGYYWRPERAGSATRLLAAALARAADAARHD